LALHNIKTKALEKECHEEGQKKNAMEKERPIKRGKMKSLAIRDEK
jgi:hypothetical protein